MHGSAAQDGEVRGLIARDSLMDKFTRVSVAIGNQVHLRSLRDAFSTIITLFILGGVAVLFDNVIFPAVMQGDMLVAWQTWGNAVLQGTQNFASVMLAAMLGFCLARNLHFQNAIGAIMVSTACFIVVIPQTIEVSGSLHELVLDGKSYDLDKPQTTDDGQFLILRAEQEAEEAQDADANDGSAEAGVSPAVAQLLTDRQLTYEINDAAEESEEAYEEEKAQLMGDAAVFTQAFTVDQFGSGGLFVAIVIGLASSTVFFKLSGYKKLRLYLGEGVPPAVASTFNVLIPSCLTILLFAGIAAVLAGAFDTNVPEIIDIVVQRPLSVFVGENIWGASLIFSIGMFLFTLGIHQTTVNGVLLTPIMQVLLDENTEAFAQGLPYDMVNYNYLNYDTQAVFGTIGGSGCTLGLIIATFLFSRSQSARAVCGLGLGPGIFEINEPIIYGYPIVYNLPLMVAFVLCSLIGYAGSYFMTVLGLMRPCVITIAWTTPPLINAFLATAGDFRAPVCQLALMIIITVVYTAFMKIAERTGTGFSDTDVLGDDFLGSEEVMEAAEG